jgi:pyridoxal phosphate enzyme (YggS family)
MDLEATWHLVGNLQSNKVSKALKLFHHIDSIHESSIAQKIEKTVKDARRIPILLEVRMDTAPLKSGVDPDDLPEIVEAILAMPHLDLRGFMCVPPYFSESDQARPSFKRLRLLRDALARRFELPFATLSMGMSNDFEIAIEEGATEIRLGTSLFGPRRQKQ